MVANGNNPNGGTLTRGTVRRTQHALPSRKKNNGKSTNSPTTTSANAAAILRNMHHDANTHVSNSSSGNQSNSSKHGASNTTPRSARNASTTPTPVDQVSVASNDHADAASTSTLTNSVANLPVPWNPTKDVLESTVSNFVRESIWPFHKFINGGRDDELLYFSSNPNSLCWFVCDKLKFQEAQKRDMWESVKPVIVRTITALRNNKIMAMRTEFMSKFLLLSITISFLFLMFILVPRAF